MAGYWLKLYTEILDDPKYFKLSDDSKLGMIELMLVAKRIGLDGEIPSIEDVAFYTRRTVEWWIPVFEELSKIEYLVINGSATIIRKFAERQAKVDVAERVRKSRELKHKKEFEKRDCNDDVTLSNGDSDSDSETDVDTDNAPISHIQDMIGRRFGLIPTTPGDSKSLDELESLGVIEDDITGAVDWFKSQGKVARYFSSVVNPIKFQANKRIQSGGGDKRIGRDNKGELWQRPDGTEYYKEES